MINSINLLISSLIVNSKRNFTNADSTKWLRNSNYIKSFKNKWLMNNDYMKLFQGTLMQI